MNNNFGTLFFNYFVIWATTQTYMNKSSLYQIWNSWFVSTGDSVVAQGRL